ncbi:MAG: hypothetical protein WCD11_12205 [Solirubrobacteraceae bacterium]
MTYRHRYRTKGWSLAKGPVALIGLALLAYGVTALIFGGHGFAQHAPTGAVYGKTWLGLEVNGWTGLLFTAAGLLLLLGAPMHWGAKTMSLIVGTSLVVLCAIALANGHGALGIFAANGVTELVWGAAGGLLIILSLLPRVGRRTGRIDERPGATRSTRRVEPGPGTVQPTPEREPTAAGGRVRPTAYGAREGSSVAPVSETSDEGYDTPVPSR